MNQKATLITWIVVGAGVCVGLSHYLLMTFGYQTGMTTLHALNVGEFTGVIALVWRLLGAINEQNRINAERDARAELMWKRYVDDNTKRDEILSDLVKNAAYASADHKANAHEKVRGHTAG